MPAARDTSGTTSRVSAETRPSPSEVADYHDLFRLAYVRGPEGLILELTDDPKPTPSGE